MTDVVQNPDHPADTRERSRTGLSAEALRRGIIDHLRYSIGRPAAALTPEHFYRATALAVRDRMQDNRVGLHADVARPRPEGHLLPLGRVPDGPAARQQPAEPRHRGARRAPRWRTSASTSTRCWPARRNRDWATAASAGWPRATSTHWPRLERPAIGYGIRYEFGIFDQEIHDGWQVEKTDNWLDNGNPWEIAKPDVNYLVNWGGYVEHYTDDAGADRVRWMPGRVIKGVAYDTPIQGYGVNTCNVLTLWSARAVESFALDAFNTGDYYKAVEDEVTSETVTKVLYPNDEPDVGKRLRLLQQYFFVSCSLQHVLHIMDDLADASVRDLPERFALQLNDTHPSIGVAELMRLLVDERRLGWDEAWDITVATFGYTNHTLLPEALETWPLAMFAESLPRHLEIIYEINRRFLDEVRAKFPGDEDRLRRMSLIGEDGGKSVRMAHLATVGSHAINGVAALHSELLKESVLKDFYEMWPERFSNKTNGVTPRRFLALANPGLRELLDDTIGEGWLKDLDRLRGLEAFVDDAAFRGQWREVKRANKARLASMSRRRPAWNSIPTGCSTSRSSAFTSTSASTSMCCTSSRCTTGSSRIPNLEIPPRAFIFGGKAAPGYFMAKRIIKLINAVGETINNDPESIGSCGSRSSRTSTCRTRT